MAALSYSLLVVAFGVPLPATVQEDLYARQRERMVMETIEQPRDRPAVKDPRVLAAMRKVPRHELVPAYLRDRAYGDHPLPIGEDQTISQPYIVAFMTELLELAPGDRVLEIGTGSGYQAAVLAEIVGATQVYTIEIIDSLAKRARIDLERLGYSGIHCRTGDGYRGWPEAAPFNAIILTAAPPQVPQPLIDQLAPGGRLVAPVGTRYMELVLLRKTADGVTRERSIPVRFVPMTGEAEKDR